MEIENLEKANRLLAEKSDLVRHLVYLTPNPAEGKVMDYSIKNSKMKPMVFVSPNHSSNTTQLKVEFLPISVKDLVELYISKLELRIKEIDEEIKNL